MIGSVEPREELYRERATRFGLETERVGRRFARIANARLAVFAVAVLVAAAGIWRRVPVLEAPAALLLAGFAVLVWYHARLRAARDRASMLQRINQEALRRIARDWDAHPRRHTIEADPSHPYALDLDVVGRASLLHLIDTTTSPMGTERLAGWLLEPAPPATVRERQAAVVELAPHVETRDELQLRGRLGGDDHSDPEPFLRWCEAGPWLRRRTVLLWCARISPLLPWAFLVAWLLKLVPAPIWPLFFFTNMILWGVLGTRADRILGEVRVQQGSVGRYAAQLALLAETPLQAGSLARLRAATMPHGVPAATYLARLDRLLSFAVPPSSPANFVTQSLFLWNVHVLDALERWQSRVGAGARTWLDALGEVEALAALAGLAHDNPSWTLPDLDPDATSISGSGVGHPLIPAAQRVNNDVTVGPPGGFLLVTGSNMSGKSTLLRSIGVNAVLAGAGGPVCATSLRLPPVRLWTSMRIADSLERGVSYFLAEVTRLKRIVDVAREEGGAVVCYLLDEMLQGTNTAERQIAARSILRHLTARRTIGAVSTHDLTLADTPELNAVATRVHFRETVAVRDGRPEMTFDYRLRPGPATSTNALRLMQAMGLIDDVP
jgi:MutS domain V